MYVCTIDLSFQAHKVEKLVVKILSFRFSSLAYVPVLKEATVAMVLQLLKIEVFWDALASFVTYTADTQCTFFSLFQNRRIRKSTNRRRCHVKALTSFVIHVNAGTKCMCYLHLHRMMKSFVIFNFPVCMFESSIR